MPSLVFTTRAFAEFQSTLDRLAKRCLRSVALTCVCPLFQSTLDRLAKRCHAAALSDQYRYMFQSTLDRLAKRCDGKRPDDGYGKPVSIHTRPFGQAMRAQSKYDFGIECFNPHSTVWPSDASMQRTAKFRPLVSIHTRPFGQAMPGNALTIALAQLFQSTLDRLAKRCRHRAERTF